MDELWQKYRSFWVPVLYGVGAFLLGLIVVHLFTGDAEAGRSQNEGKARAISRRVVPNDGQISAVKQNEAALRERVAAWARRVDQRHGESEDPLEAYVGQALRAAVLRGSATPDEARFDGDRNAAASAAARYEQLRADRIQLLRTQDPNISFSRLKADVAQELLLRANRADVDVGNGVDEIGFSGVTTVDRGELPRRLANLALVATVLDVAIREGIRSIDAVQLIQPEIRLAAQGSESFLQEWPVRIDLTGPPQALAAILNLLTDPERPTPVGTCQFRMSGRKDGMVKAEMKLYSVQVRPEAPLGLESEG